MAEQPVKIFATRAERYPEPGVPNETRALVKSGLSRDTGNRRRTFGAY